MTKDIKVYVNVPRAAGKVLAFADVVFAFAGEANGFRVNGLRVLESAKGLWVAMPSRKRTKPDKGGNEYEDVFHPVSAATRTLLFNAVLEAYESKQENPPADA